MEREEGFFSFSAEWALFNACSQINAKKWPELTE